MNDAPRAAPVGPILLVEDEPDVCAFLSDELGQAGYEVVCASNDNAAYEALEQNWRSFSAVILDVNLGQGTTGFDVARYARRLKANIPVIFTTGFNSENSVARYGVPDSVFVSKPFSGADMVAALHELTGRAKAG